MRMNNWSLRRKILLGYGAVLVLLTFVFGWALARLVHLGDASEAILNENYRSIRAADNMISAIERQNNGVLLYLLGFREEGLEQYREQQVRFSGWLARAQDNITIQGERQVLAAIDSSYAAYLMAFSRLLDGEPSRAAYQEMVAPAFLAVREASVRLRGLNEQTMFSASNRAEEVAHMAILSVSGIGLLALGLGFVLSLLLSNRLVRPIHRIERAARRVAKGDYDVEVPSDSSDEFGQLARQFNEMAAKLRGYRAMNIEQIKAEKRKSEAIIQSIDDGLIVIGANLNIVNLNPAAEKVLGVTADEAQGHHFLETVKNDQLFDCVKETLTSGDSPSIDENETFLSIKHNGKQRHYQFAITPVYISPASMIGAIVLLRDVTTLKELDRLKSEFVATASHELKTPLTSISMSLGLLQERTDGRLGAQEQELLSTADEDVERLRDLVNDLLDLSKIEAGKIELEFNRAPVALLFEKAIQNLKTQAEEHALDLSSEIPDALPSVHVDATKITWVLTNLISNALRYTDAGGYIRLSAEQVGDNAHISVEDNGEGIPYDHQSKIFDKFVQVDSRKEAGGTGLGLTICKEIVQAHGGRIWVDSTPGEGSTFTFTLPMA